MSFDWTRISDDPNNREAKAEARALLPRPGKVHTDTDLEGLRLSACHLVRSMAGLSRNLKFLACRLDLASIEYSFPDYLFEFSFTEN